jgi:hypothetical protein
VKLNKNSFIFWTGWDLLLSQTRNYEIDNSFIHYNSRMQFNWKLSIMFDLHSSVML